MVKIVEVAPRDGLQNEKEIIPLEKKAEFVEKLAETGVVEIEVGSFVSPKWVPQLKDTDELFRKIAGLMGEMRGKVKFSALVPNIKGFERVMNLPQECRPTKIAVFTASSETFNRKNVNASIKESLQKIKKVVDEAKREKFEVRGYVSTAFWCPYEGKIPPEKTLWVSEELMSIGVDEISIGDTIGRASPKDVSDLLSVLLKKVDKERISLHFHDTYGTAVLNSYISFRDFGITMFDSSAGGLGGCPYAPGASGNVATEDLVFAFESSGIKTGVKIKKVVDALRAVSDIVRPRSHISQVLARGKTNLIPE